MSIKFMAIDPRPAQKDAQLDMLKELKSSGYNIIGFEATLSWLDEFCDHNFDPQHKEGNSEISCIEQVLWYVQQPFPVHKKVAMVTVRADLDSVGGMAVYLSAMQSSSDCMMYHYPTDRINWVAQADKYTQGEWKPRPMFEGNDSGALAPIARFVSDFRVLVQERVEGMKAWLERGTEPDASYRLAYEAEREQIRQAVKSGETKVTVVNEVAVVESTLRAATSIGYVKAPIVVCINPTFSFGGGEPHRKVTICQYGESYIDLKEVFSSLGNGWGGSPTIGGSPQGVDCQTSVESILLAIEDAKKISVSLTRLDIEALRGLYREIPQDFNLSPQEEEAFQKILESK